MGTSKSARKKSTILKEKELEHCWTLLEKDSVAFTPLMLVTKAAYALENKYIQLKEMHDDIYDEASGKEQRGEHDLIDIDSDEETGYCYGAGPSGTLTSEDLKHKSLAESNKVGVIREFEDSSVLNGPKISGKMTGFFLMMMKARDFLKVYSRSTIGNYSYTSPAVHETIIQSSGNEALTPQEVSSGATVASEYLIIFHSWPCKMILETEVEAAKIKKISRLKGRIKIVDQTHNDVNKKGLDEAPRNKRQRFPPKKYSDYVPG
ncbi:hypothetical protein QAD02_008314 [Eretmocerus hayati]|uniref:Uncharacterized protein n=1 Tax=Eretmocerus hayati TaxID=131215 RepID=A0ACC2N6H1_9HYME|nr:hypothetical protein QAD02_008314 [Eretmocerus hayati]